MEARADIAKRVLARMSDDFSAAPLGTDASFTQREQTPSPLNPGSVPNEATSAQSLQELVEGYASDRGRAVSDATRRANRSRLKLLVAYFGATHDLKEIGTREMERFRNTVMDLPRDPFRTLPDTPLKDMPRIAEERGIPAADRNNARIILETASSFFRHLQTREYIDRNPCEGLSIKKDPRAARKRRPFAVSELQLLFEAKPYAAEAASGRRRRQGRYDGAYWIPLIGLFTGMRLAEICQLWSDDVGTIDGIPSIQVRHNPAREQRLKTIGSERAIPIHRELIRLGLFEWVQTRPSQAARLFPDVPYSSSGSPSDVFSKRFATRMKRIELHGKGIVFHSFRHTFVDAMRNARIDEASQKAIGGWAAKDVHGQYGQGPSIQRLKEAIDQVWFERGEERLALDYITPFRRPR
jgi:integrase